MSLSVPYYKLLFETEILKSDGHDGGLSRGGFNCFFWTMGVFFGAAVLHLGVSRL